MRRPLVTNGLRGSSGIVFLFSVMPASSSVVWATLPVSSASNGRRSTTIRWLSVPPDTSRKPSAASASASADALAHDLVGVLLKDGCGGLAERHRLAGDDVLERPALPAGEHRLVDRLRRARPCDRMQPPRGPRSVLCVVNVTTSAYGTGSGCGAAGDQPGDVGGVEHEQRADLVGDRPERLGIEAARVARRAGDDHLRAVLEGEVADLVDVDALVARRDLVGDEVVQHAAGVDRRAVGEVAAVVEAEAEHGVARLEQRLVHAHVGVGAGVRLDVGVLGAEQRLGPLDGQRLDVVDDRVAAVVALARDSPRSTCW